MARCSLQGRFPACIPTPSADPRAQPLSALLSAHPSLPTPRVPSLVKPHRLLHRIAEMKFRQSVRAAMLVFILAVGVDHYYPVELWLKALRGGAAPLRPPVKPATISEPQPVPPEIIPPPWGFMNATLQDSKEDVKWSLTQQIHDTNSADALRAAGLIASDALNLARTLIQPGVTTDALDEAVHRYIIGQGAYPSPLYYDGYPKSICTSVNEVMVHGIPDARPLEEGDMIKVDVSVYYRGQHADTCATFTVGQVSETAKHLVETTRRALEAAVAACGPGRPVGDIGRAVQAVADNAGLHTVRTFVGHGIGAVFHGRPRIYGFAPAHQYDVPALLQLYVTKDWSTPLKPGMAITIEPILVEAGGTTRTDTWSDGWTVASRDRSLSSQFEFTVLVRDPLELEEGQAGCEVITPFPWEETGAGGAEAAVA